MPTVADILKASGLSQEQISAIDAKVMDGLTAVYTSAMTAQEKAEFAQRAQRAEYDERIAPALANWADQDTRLSTENAAYKTYMDKLRASGYVPKEMLEAMPTFGPVTSGGTPGGGTPTPGHGPDGRFVAGGNTVPGSPGPGYADVEKKLRDELGGAFSFAVDTQWKYRQLFGQEMPDAPTAIIREAMQNRMEPAAWAAKKYDFAAKEKAIIEAKQKEHDDAIRKEVGAAKDREWSERVGNNPNVRMPQESAFSEVSKAVSQGQRKDPLKMTPEERKSNTHANIQKEFRDRETSSSVQ